MKNELKEVIPKIMPYDRPVMSIKEAEKELKELQEFIKEQMKEDTDFGIIPNCTKPSLWKPGAEKLVNFHGLSVEYKESPSTIRDWDNNFFNFDYKCKLTSGRGRIITGVGSCNSKEKKYITQDGYTLVNTIQKMAKKRAFIDAVLTATRASFYFTQDMEEVNNDKEKENEIEEVPATEETPQPKSTGKKTYPISPNQRKAMEKNNITIPDNCSYAQASKLIKESMAKGKKKPVRGNGKDALVPPPEEY